MYNATNDLTDQDKVSFQYNNLMKNRMKSEADIELEIAKEKDYRKSWQFAVLDMLFGVLIMIIVGFIVYLPALLENS